jgi:hypothetical protein
MSHPPPPHGRRLQQLHGPFGVDRFGRQAEAFARFFGTPRFLIGQSVVVVLWIGANVAAATLRWDPYPFILLNLAFSLQAAYVGTPDPAGPDPAGRPGQVMIEADADHRETFARDALRRENRSAQEIAHLRSLVEANTALIERVERLAAAVHDHLLGRRRAPGGGAP